MTKPKTTFLPFSREMTPFERGIVSEICQRHGASLLYWGPTRQTPHTGWLTWNEPGNLFLGITAQKIKQECSEHGIDPWDT